MTGSGSELRTRSRTDSTGLLAYLGVWLCHSRLGKFRLWYQFRPRKETYNADVSPEPAPLRSSRSRVLGLDVGAKTIGLAVSDPLGITAQGLPTLRRKNKRTDFERLEELIRQYQVGELVVGYPLNMSGIEGKQGEKMRSFAEDLRQRFALPVHLWDERLTSAEANRLLREMEVPSQRRRRVVDRMAAVLILQSWMDQKGALGRSLT
jgi:putative holliday junction resolvase